MQVRYLTELLQDMLEYAPARPQAITAALGSVLVGAASGRLTHRTLRMRSA